ncbi:MAG TPA: hypothetical protein VF290_17715 [Pyrinomonadaceae bacterium]
MATITLSVDFGIFPDNLKFPTSFTLGGYTFNDLSGAGRLFANETSGEIGLQFTKTGIEVILPVPVDVVDLRVGAFAGPLKIIAKNSAGTVVGTQDITITSRFLDVQLKAPKTASVSLVNGGNEGILRRISTTIYCT